MQDLNDLHYFARVVEAGGFSAAARLLGLPKSRLSRRVAELEVRLGARLLQRTTRKLVLTEVGGRFYQHCQAMLQEAEAAEQTIAALTEVPRGRLRVSCPVALAQGELSRFLPEFLSRYPQVRLEMLLVNRRVDLFEEAVDVALRVRAEGDEDPALVSRRLRPAESILVAAPGLLAGKAISTPADLQALPVLGAIEADRRVHWRLFDADGEVADIAAEPRLAADDFVLRRVAAVAGLGVTMLPRVLCADELAQGTLLQVLPNWRLSGGNLQAVYAHRRGLLPAMRAFIDFLVEAYSREPGRAV
ncbi:LysR substrate-binding domain-containing protein [Chitinimonas sp.]|uniref:LysR substrate-binding domain-containing protein n=1 Tax=Chitinimonas sp. TaxID=1934313 RepID=UPI0035B17DA4